MHKDWPIFVLTLEGEEARRQPLSDALNRAGIPFRLFFGVDGRSSLTKEHELLVDRREARKKMGRCMADSEFACALSHRDIYETIQRENLAGAVILEDDAVISPVFVRFIEAGLHRTETMILMDYRFGRALPWQKRKVGGWTFYRAAQRATLASTYSLSRETAVSLLKATTPVSYVADWPVDLYAVNAWLAVPRVTSQRNDPEHTSLIGAARSELEKSTTKSVRRYLSRDYYSSYFRRRLARRVGR